MREQLLEILNENCPGINFEQESALIDDGIIDSLDIVAIVSEIMNEFNIEISVDDLKPENFNTVDNILNLIRNRQL